MASPEALEMTVDTALPISTPEVPLAGEALVAASLGGRRRMVEYLNPVCDLDLPDPHVIWVERLARFVGYFTQGNGMNLQVAVSTDLVHWEDLHEGLPKKPRFANRTQNFWAPEVCWVDELNKYVLKGACERNPEWRREGEKRRKVKNGMGRYVAVSDSPLGPFEVIGEMDEGGQKNDSFRFIDYLTVIDPETGDRMEIKGSIDTIMIRRLGKDGISYHPEEGNKVIMKLDPENKYSPEGVVEAAWLNYMAQVWWMTYSVGGCFSPTPGKKDLREIRRLIKNQRCDEAAALCSGGGYAVAAAAADTINGEFKFKGFTLEGNNKLLAPGHHCVVNDERGYPWMDGEGRYWSVYHAVEFEEMTRFIMNRCKGPLKRSLCIDPIDFSSNRGIPLVANGTPSIELTSGPTLVYAS